MKLDTDHVNFHPITPPRKSYNPFDSDDDNETSDSIALKPGNLFPKEDANRFEHLTFEKNPDTISFHLDNGDFLWEEAMPTTTLPSATDHHTNGANSVVLKEGGQLYTDKTVTECDLPELVVCCKESNNQLVKDIGIDEGVVVPPPENRMWIRSREEESSSKDPCEFLDLDKHCFPSDNVDLKVQTRNSVDEVTDIKASESTLPPSDDDCQKKSEDFKNEDGLSTAHLVSGQYLVHDLGAGDASMVTSQLKLELDNRAAPSPSGSTTGDVSEAADSVSQSAGNPVLSDDTILVNPEASTPTWSVLNSQDGLLNLGDAVEIKEEDASVDKPDLNTLLQEGLDTKDSLPGEPSTVSSEEGVKPEKSQFLEQESQTSAHPPDHSTPQEESDEGSSQGKLAYNSKLESATITFDFDNTSSNIEKEEGGKIQNIECSKPPDTQAMTRQGEEGVTADAAATASASSSSSDHVTFSSILERRGQGETSFSHAACPPSSITFTGPVSYSGSVSLRSESSAGSTRSFAFPVLQTEWNSSPVRMAKADQRHFKKQRGWVQAVICCKF